LIWICAALQALSVGWLIYRWATSAQFPWILALIIASGTMSLAAASVSRTPRATAVPYLLFSAAAFSAASVVVDVLTRS
jgi:hypothetical protein